MIRSNHSVQNVFKEQFKDGWKVGKKSSFLYKFGEKQKRITALSLNRYKN